MGRAACSFSICVHKYLNMFVRPSQYIGLFSCKTSFELFMCCLFMCRLFKLQIQSEQPTMGCMWQLKYTTYIKAGIRRFLVVLSLGAKSHCKAAASFADLHHLDRERETLLFLWVWMFQILNTLMERVLQSPSFVLPDKRKMCIRHCTAAEFLKFVARS